MGFSHSSARTSFVYFLIPEGCSSDAPAGGITAAAFATTLIDSKAYRKQIADILCDPLPPSADERRAVGALDSSLGLLFLEGDQALSEAQK